LIIDICSSLIVYYQVGDGLRLGLELGFVLADLDFDLLNSARLGLGLGLG